MMFRNVNYALPSMTALMADIGQESTSRNGSVLTIDEPFTLQTLRPTERVLLCPVRRANPFLFLLDGLSVLSCVNLVKPLSDIAPRFLSFTDDNITLRGHYGARLRPQLGGVIEMLTEQPTNRRVVLQIWDRALDLGAESNDIPCNVMVIPRIVDGALDLTVFNRSNDLYWGMLGANIVQFSFLQEYLARRISVRIGRLFQISTNLHAYTNMGPGRCLRGYDSGEWKNPFGLPSHVYPPVRPLDTDNLLNDLDMMFMALAADAPLPPTRNEFLAGVVYPMIQAWQNKDLGMLDGYPDCDWFQAARMYGVK